MLVALFFIANPILTRLSGIFYRKLLGGKGISMHLNKKIFFLLGSLFIFLGITQWRIQEKLIVPSFFELEKNEALSNIKRTVETARGDLNALDRVCFDWSAWTDTWNFAKDGNPEYIKSNLLIGTFREGRIHLFFIVDASGKVMWGQIFDPETMTSIHLERFSEIQMDPADPLFALPQSDTPQKKVVKGLLLTSRGPLMVTSRPILKSDYTGPEVGHLIMGRFVDSQFLKEIKKRVQTNVDLVALNSTSQKKAWATIISGFQKGMRYQFKKFQNHLEVYTVIPDIMQEPALLIRTQFPRDISRKGLRSVYFALFSLLIVSFIVLLVVGLIIQHLILRPIQELTRHAGQIQIKKDFTLRMGMGRKDEIGELSNQFDAMVAKIDDQTSMLRELSMKDGLTGLANRREFDRHLKLEWQRMQREKSPLTLIMCDVDLFKSYNDRYGHPAGDKCLSQVAKAMEDSVKRPGDLVARYGGEEFAVILPNTREKEGFQMAEAIRKTVENLKIVHPDGPFGLVTMSLGGASVVPTSETDLSTFLKTADDALYKAKSNTRNRTVFHRHALSMGS